MTSNFDRFMFITRDLGAPEIFLRFAYLAGVSAALERRVFYGDLNRPLFPNNYTLLVGPAGIGKGQSMREIRRIIAGLPKLGSDGRPLMDKSALDEFVPLFHALSDTMTFEAVVDSMARNSAQIVRPDGKGLYQHSSSYICLEELSSLLRINKADDVARLLLNLYDCEPFEYKTKKAGTHRIRNGCLNIIAGTTLDFLAKAEQSGLVGEGLFSRMTIVYADVRAFDRFEQHSLSEQQLQAQKELQTHFFRLGHLFGAVNYTAETLAWLENWWAEESLHLSAFGDEKLANYFSRRKVQVMKLALALHFSESLSFTVPLSAFQTAASMVRSLEEPIIRLAKRTGRNTHYSTIERFVARLSRTGAMTHGEALQHLSSDLTMSDIINTLQLLEQSGRIRRDGEIWKPQSVSPAAATPAAASTIVL